jgi:primosomal protein N'
MFEKFHSSEGIIFNVPIDLMSEKPYLYSIPEGEENFSGCRVLMSFAFIGILIDFMTHVSSVHIVIKLYTNQRLQ